MCAIRKGRGAGACQGHKIDKTLDAIKYTNEKADCSLHVRTARTDRDPSERCFEALLLALVLTTERRGQAWARMHTVSNTVSLVSVVEARSALRVHQTDGRAECRLLRGCSREALVVGSALGLCWPRCNQSREEGPLSDIVVLARGWLADTAQ